MTKHIYHTIVCIGALVAHRENDCWAVDALGAPPALRCGTTCRSGTPPRCIWAGEQARRSPIAKSLDFQLKNLLCFGELMLRVFCPVGLLFAVKAGSLGSGVRRKF
jgi:hypothetical protein